MLIGYADFLTSFLCNSCDFQYFILGLKECTVGDEKRLSWHIKAVCLVLKLQYHQTWYTIVAIQSPGFDKVTGICLASCLF